MEIDIISSRGIDPHRLVPHLCGRRAEHAPRRRHGVVHERVDPSVGVDGLRDELLAVSGRLDGQIGGPSVKELTSPGNSRRRGRCRTASTDWTGAGPIRSWSHSAISVWHPRKTTRSWARIVSDQPVAPWGVTPFYVYSERMWANIEFYAENVVPLEEIFVPLGKVR